MEKATDTRHVHHKKSYNLILKEIILEKATDTRHVHHKKSNKLFLKEFLLEKATNTRHLHHNKLIWKEFLFKKTTDTRHLSRNQSLHSFTSGGGGRPLGSVKRGLGIERARLVTFRGFVTERAKLGTFRGFGTECARLARLSTLNQNFEIFTKNEHLPVQRFFFQSFGRKSKNRPTFSDFDFFFPDPQLHQILNS